jgi:K+-dependent Na+/Ca+ exchanger-like protein
MTIAAYKRQLIGSRRTILGKYGQYFGLVAFAACLAIVGAQHFSGTTETNRRALQEESYYPAGTCDSGVYTTMPYKFIVLGLLCWSIYYMFWGLAIICDDYFVASLEEICEALGLSADVAGATFMAAGSSAPELFTSLMGVFAVKSDVGVGTIVGSAVFNLCCIIGGTAVFTPGTLKIDWKPITRDTIFYAISIIAMIVVLSDGIVTATEAVALVGTYFIYVFVMAVNGSLMACLDKCCGTTSSDGSGEIDEDDDDDEPGPISKAVASPLTILFKATVPDCSEEENKSKYLVTFLMSIFWIGVLSFYMVEWASKLGCILNIHPAVMGCTLLAAGTSVPDAIGSLLVAKAGQGDMAVSNAIGSNVFDILLGLGIPWALNDIIYKTELGVDRSNLLPLSIFLISTLAAVYLVALCSGFKLTAPVGVFYISLYFLFVAYSLAHSFEIISW